MKELHALAAAVLTRLGIPFTSRALRRTVDAEYFLTMRGGTVSAQVRRALAIIDRRDATNRLIVLCKILRRYHVRQVVGDSPADQTGVYVVAGDALAIAEDRPSSDATFVFFYANEFSEEAGYSANRSSARLQTAGLVLGAVVALAAIADRPFTLLPFVGLLVSAFLVVYEADPKVSAWAASHGCEHEKIRMSCASVLKSRASKLFGVISLADIGVVYFAAELFQRVPSWYALAPLPLSLFAIGYQAVVVRAWCPFCLLIHVVLWAQAVMFFGQTGVPSALSAVIAAAMVYLARRLLRLKTHANALELQHQHWVRDGELFKKLFDGPPAIQFAPPGAAILGQRNAAIRMTAVLSPNCAPCKTTFRTLLKLKDWLDGRIAITLLFTDGPLQQATLKLCMAGRNDDAVALIRWWYFGKEKPPLEFELTETERTIRQAHADWIKKHRITMTPALFFNSRAVPDEFHDLTLLGEMIEDHWIDSQLVEGVA